MRAFSYGHCRMSYKRSATSVDISCTTICYVVWPTSVKIFYSIWVWLGTTLSTCGFLSGIFGVLFAAPSGVSCHIHTHHPLSSEGRSVHLYTLYLRFHLCALYRMMPHASLYHFTVLNPDHPKEAWTLGWDVLNGGRRVLWNEEDLKYSKTMLTGSIIGYQTNVRKLNSSGLGSRQSGNRKVDFEGELIDVSPTRNVWRGGLGSHLEPSSTVAYIPV